MPHRPKLFLYSLFISGEQCVVLNRLVGKEAKDITFALIENAADVVKDSGIWVEEIREALKVYEYNIEPVDLRHWRGRGEELRQKLARKDVVWLGGGNTFYLRWILKDTGADNIITELVKGGKVYAGWSAGAIVAGPTLHYFDAMDDPAEAPEVIWEGLHLTDKVVVPHMDHKLFEAEAGKAAQGLKRDGYNTVPLNDTEILVINGNAHKVI